ncbi:MAG: acyl-CoA dehydrogenase family protein [Chloroflexota bacterium]
MQPHMYEEEHRMFRDAFRQFLDKEVVPYEEEWSKAGIVDRDLWRKAGENGFLALEVPEKFDGMGVNDFRFNTILSEEMARTGATAPGFSVHSDIVVPYIEAYGSDEQKARWLPGCASGEIIAAIAMTEPGTGSDLQGVQTTATKQGDHYIINGQKTFISNGIHCDIVIVVARTSDAPGYQGLSLIMVERGMDGFENGRNLDKIGLKGQDTAELFFDSVKVPAENLLGEEGMGFIYLMQQLPQERLIIGIQGLAGAEVCLDWTIEYCKERMAFGKPIGKFQNSRFKLAEMKTEVTVGRAFIDQCILDLNEGNLSTEKASMAKYWCTDLFSRVVDECVQLHGGYGYMSEYPISKAYLDSRVGRIYGGTNEIMKEIIGRAMGF